MRSVGRISLSASLTLCVARQGEITGPCTVFLQSKGKEERGAATALSVGLFGFTGIKKEGKVCPPSSRPSPSSEMEPTACVCFF